MSREPCRLYFLHQPDCPACGEARPFVQKWKRDHPEVKVFAVDLTAIDWRADWAPEVTPTFVMLSPGGKVDFLEGLTTREDFEKWAKRHIS